MRGDLLSANPEVDVAVDATPQTCSSRSHWEWPFADGACYNHENALSGKALRAFTSCQTNALFFQIGARGMPGVARSERSDKRVEMIGYILGRCADRPDLNVQRVVHVIGGVPGIPRHHFVPVTERVRAYQGTALEIGWGRTTPGAYLVVLMAELAVPVRTHEVGTGAGGDARGFTTPRVAVSGHKVLEVGTAAGYLAAVLSEMVDHVYTIEPVEELATKAAANLANLGYGNVAVQLGGPFEGRPELAPYNSIGVRAPVDPVPRSLIDQLAVGGTLLAPVGPADGSVERRWVLEVSFPPLTKHPDARAAGIHSNCRSSKNARVSLALSS